MSRAGKSSRRYARTSRRLAVVAALSCLSLCALMWQTWRIARAMDLARAETRVDLAASTFGVSGQGVIVALLDRGIDWKNNDFRNSDGTTRIKYIFDLTDNTGANAPGNTYGRGTIYTEAQINAALNGGTPLAIRDAIGHGTTTAGIAAGNGRNLASLKYRGVAPNATIIAVKVTTEGAPAHDDQPAEAPFNDATVFPVAINFVRDKAAELGRPAVMLLNLGSINGPTDGTSELARKIDSTVGPGKPGLVFVTGAGDDGGMPNHAGGTVTQATPASIQIQKGSAGAMIFDLWYGGGDRFNVSLQTPSGNFGPYTSPATNDAEDFQQTSAFAYYHKGANKVFYGAQNGKREIFININGPAGTYTVQLQGQTVVNGRFDATINPSNIHQAAGQSNRFLNFVVPGSIWDAATARYNICPNSYVIRTNWTDIDGIARSITGEGNPGELWPGSSVGPTFDGRLGIDVSAPGNSVFTTYNPKSYFATFRFNLIQDGGGFYGRADAVSAAAPQVAGIIALMLEKNPQLNAAQVKSLLQESARTDSFTGQTPNPNWGYGKVDAYNAVSLAAQSATANPLDDARFFVRQHYFDFLNRAPDQGGEDYWTSQITGCGADQNCIRNRRIDVSNAFFYELEYQQTGSYVYRLYRIAYGNNQPFPNPGPDSQPSDPIKAAHLPSYAVFSADRARVIGGASLAQSQLDLANQFVSRTEFLNKYPSSLATGAQFVDALLATIQNDLGVNLTSQRDALINLYNQGGRGSVMYHLADDNAQSNPINNRALIDAEYNRSFVLTQYFGYLKRDPDLAGLNFWYGQVNRFPLRNVGIQHAMVCSFITSSEYQLRFGPIVTHSNQECPQ